jgi:superfamily II DNA or RNA helicase
MPPAQKQDILDEIHRIETLVRDLDERRGAALARMDELRERLATAEAATQMGVPALASGSAPSAPESAPTSPLEKVRLFRGLFRGRQDVFPRLWVNQKKGTRGYSPACSNEWARGVCEKPRVKCGACSKRAFVRVGDQVVIDHLKGRHVIGIYPLLEDDTCWLLAVDFDKGNWRDDVVAFRETCVSFGFPVAVERSRSGNGAHAWFFFAAPIVAAAARQMGCFLLTETMARRHQLGMRSYDRLFPNQDTLPRGGFGNLIALPLQQQPRLKGNTVFLDEDLAPLADQWAFLAALQRLDPESVSRIAQDALRRGRVLGVRSVGLPDEPNPEPWARRPSGHVATMPIAGPLPPEVRAVLSQRLFVEKAGLPSALIDQIQRVAAFQNPEFFKRQSMRLSTAMTPRVICCAEDLSEHIALPRGCVAELESLLTEHNVRLTVADQRIQGKPVAYRFAGQLTPLQAKVAQALLSHDTGVFVGPPGIGKTVLGTYLIAKRGHSALVLVHRQPLLAQWTAQLAMFLGIEEKEIGQIGGGKKKPNGRLDVAMLQSVVRQGCVDDRVANYGHVIVDECHHIPAFSFERVLSEIKARYIVGLTATLQRRDGLHPITEMQIGPTRYSVDTKGRSTERPFDHRLVVRETSFSLAATDDDILIQEIYSRLASDQARNELILNDVIHAIEERRSPIVLTERRDHLDLFASRLKGFVRHIVVLQGGMSPKKRRESAAQIAAIPDDEERLVLATGRYVGEGFDDARMDTLFLALPISWKGTLIQYSGRLHRLHPGKSEVRIFDYVDQNVPMLQAMFRKRLRTYRAIGYARDEAPLGYREVVDEPTIAGRMTVGAETATEKEPE